ncbi:phage major capsid protein [Rhodococcus sp. IEGM 1379]|uniref:phage major capsid protein n=1 Tax=Rhodococcus sp. IEGM 1379 TaxID=3047086 RepID=UPI0024B8319B|nr:phage major capsid protein [Rhodococcus sp. IEGM 1379]MDI9917863.1 phage major capsid protein [Rhodococcus sp. IEGM 1379]
MSLYTPGQPRTFLPEEIAELVTRPVEREALSLQVSTVVSLPDGVHEYRVPIVAADPTAEWTAEGAEIGVSDPDLDETSVIPRKLAGLTIISREMARDSSPEATDLVGKGLARDLARKLDAAFFGTNVTAAGPPVVRNGNRPLGLEDVVGVSEVDTGGTIVNTDVFAEAISKAEEVGATIDHFVANPADLLTLAKVKKATGSNEPLLGTDATSPSKRVVLGVPILPSSAVRLGTIWALPKDRIHTAVRESAELAVDESAYFTSDRIAVRAILRAGFVFPHEEAIVKIFKKI